MLSFFGSSSRSSVSIPAPRRSARPYRRRRALCVAVTDRGARRDDRGPAADGWAALAQPAAHAAKMPTPTHRCVALPGETRLEHGVDGWSQARQLRGDPPHSPRRGDSGSIAEHSIPGQPPTSSRSSRRPPIRADPVDPCPTDRLGCPSPPAHSASLSRPPERGWPDGRPPAAATQEGPIP